MFTTSLAALAATSLMASNMAVQPNWLNDYSRALTVSAEQHKPIAVFITNGGANHLLKDEGMGSEASKLLRDSYVALHVDTTTAKGAELAKTFDLKEGLVISDRNGSLQALRHGGSLTPSELQEYLTKYSTTTTVATTDYQGAAVKATPAPAAIQYYVPGASSCPNCRK
jgi:hypothetical protein